MLLADRYRLVRHIATGGMGTVHEAVDERLRRRIAVKILKDEYSDDPRFVERFSREARSTAALRHPNVAQVLDFGQDGGQHFIVMEFVDGEHLGQLLREEGRLTPRRAVGVATQVCSALSAAHTAGIVHRDVKPGNVMVRPDGQVMVTDFGIAQTTGQVALTGTGAVLGTAQYLSPEQASGQAVTPASDLYSVGILLFQMLTGRVPFTDDSPVTVALRHIREEVPSARDVASDVPATLAAVVARATAKDPRQRYGDARQMETALREAVAAPPDAAPTDAAPTAVLPAGATATLRSSRRAARFAGLPRAWLLGASALLLAGVLAAGWTALFGDSSSPQADPAAAQPGAGGVQAPAPSASPSERTGSPAPSPEPSASGPVVPADAVGSDVRALEQQLKDGGYTVRKVDVESSAPKGSIVGTIPGPGEPLTAEQTVVLVTSKAQASDESVRYVVPDGIVGSRSDDAKRLLEDQDVEVKTVDVDSAGPKGIVVATYPDPGTSTSTATVVLAVSTGK